MFDLTLLLDPDGTEWSFMEARARHLGLLGKKWPALPMPNPAVTLLGPVPRNDTEVKERSVKVDFNDQGTKMAKVARRQSVTVTINTKQALDDVLDMYNSPVRDDAAAEAGAKLWLTPGNSHAGSPAPTGRPPVFRDENAGVNPRPRGKRLTKLCPISILAGRKLAFQPYMDQKRENATPGPLQVRLMLPLTQ